MTTLALTFAAPWQAWGTTGRFEVRGTELWPTKSAVVGLVANAMGRDYDDDITDLTSLRFGVRVDRHGVVETDYHTSGAGRFPVTSVEVAVNGGSPDDAPLTMVAYEVAAANDDGTPPRFRRGNGTATLSLRSYLADAVFTVALTDSVSSVNVELVAASLSAPMRQLYLGRRSCPPVSDMIIGCFPTDDIIDVLASVPRPSGATHGPLMTFVEDQSGDVWSASRPLGFSRAGRRYGTQRYRSVMVNPPSAEVTS